MKYRPDIDGLRAIAILFVLFFHAGLKIFPSGFIGVDIFFVISGFLITRIIHESLQNNHFSFSEFYGRRLWRLQPVFICMVLITTFIALYYFLPTDLRHLSKSARAAFLFKSNIYFEKITTGYFSQDSSKLPLLHAWSLSIEWQCYLILPLVIYLLHRTFGNHNLAKIIYGLTLLFFALSLYISSKDPTHTYYHFLSRIFEFLIGSCIALGPSRFTFNKYFLNLLSTAAIVTLFYIATRSDIKQGFPNWYSFILCIATGVYIASGEQSYKPILTRVLSVKPIVFIGLLSYSLYIWHWPLFVFIRYQNINETTTFLSLIFCLLFILAYLSWRFIEKPTRKFKNTKYRYSLIYLLLIPIVVTHISYYQIKKHQGYPERFEGYVRVDEQLKRYDNAQRPLCLQKKNIAVNNNCLLGSKKQKSQTGFMIGDSFSNHSWGFMDTLGKKAHLSILAHATESCLTLPGIAQYDWNGYSINEIYHECFEQTARYYRMIKANHYDYVIIGQRWNGYLSNANFINQLNDARSEELTRERIAKALDKALKIISDSGAKPVLINTIAIANDSLYNCVFDQIKDRRKYDPERCYFEYLKSSEEQWLNDLFLRMKSKYAQLIIIDPQTVQCSKDRCMAAINGVPVFRDAAHLTDYASYQLAKLYLQQYKNPLLT